LASGKNGSFTITVTIRIASPKLPVQVETSRSVSLAGRLQSNKQRHP